MKADATKFFKDNYPKRKSVVFSFSEVIQFAEEYAKSQLEAKEEYIMDLTEDRDRLAKQLEAKEKEIEQAKKTASRMVKTREDRIKELEDYYEYQLEERDKEIEALKLEVKHDNEELIKLESQLSEHSPLMREYPAKFRKMQEEIDRLRKLLRLHYYAITHGQPNIPDELYLTWYEAINKQPLVQNPEPPIYRVMREGSETLTICAECEEAKEGAYCGACRMDTKSNEITLEEYENR